MLVYEWKMAIYCIILMAWFSYYSPTTKDRYTTFLRTEEEFGNANVNRASIVMKMSACIGGTVAGYVSQSVGRHHVMVVSALISAVLIPPWTLPNGFSNLSAYDFFMQFFVQDAWGVTPIHLNELSPLAFRSTVSGMRY